MSASPSALSDTLWSQLSEFVAERIGLHFPPERRDDLKRGLTSAAVEFGFADVAVCAEWLLSAALARGSCWPTTSVSERRFRRASCCRNCGSGALWSAPSS